MAACIRRSLTRWWVGVDKGKCAKGAKKVTWQLGTPGPQGVQGIQGIQGVQGVPGVAGPGARVFTASGTYAVPAGTKQLEVELWGGGGGGGNIYGNAGGGGGGQGGYVRGLVVAPGATLPVTVGAAGPIFGGSGGASSIGTLSAAGGGGGGSASAPCTGGTGGAGGTAGSTTGADLVIEAHAGQAGTNGDCPGALLGTPGIPGGVGQPGSGGTPSGGAPGSGLSTIMGPGAPGLVIVIPLS